MVSQTGDDATLIEGGSPSSMHAGEVAPSMRVGRYVLGDRIGRGAMGEVFRAHDPELDREIAIKVVWPPRFRGDAAPSRAKLMREAQAVALLSHPNVVTIHDVGPCFSDDAGVGPIYIAMELVEGETIREWMDAAPPRSWREVLSVFLPAGRGLAAAHAAGVVHRDFKPANVLIGRDRRIRVTDFGLARIVGSPSESATQSDADASGSRAGGAPGTLSIGTPGYMAPEQQRGDSYDVRADIFGFCAALYEALYGVKAFAGDRAEAVMLAVDSGQITPPPSGVSVPAPVRRIAERGLSRTPEGRPPSMEVVLAELERAARPSRGRAFLVGGITVVGLGVGLAWWPRAEPCLDAAHAIEERWDPTRREAVSRALHGLDVPDADLLARTAVAELDAYAVSWTTVRMNACRAAATTPPDLVDARTRCLERGLSELGGLVDMLGEADVALAAGTLRAIERLPLPTTCDDPQYLLSEVPPPSDPAIARQVAALREQLAEVATLRSTGEREEALREAVRVHTEAAALGYAPLTTEAELVWALCLEATGESAAAREHARAAYFAAQEAGLDGLAAASAVALVTALTWSNDFEGAREWQAHAEAALARSPSPERAISMEVASGHLARRTGDYPEAQRRFEAAREHADELFGAGSLEVADAELELAKLARVRGEVEVAKEILDGARERFVRHLGPAHPRIADIEVSYGNIAVIAGDWAAAERHARRAIEIIESWFGPGTPSAISARSDLANALVALGRPGEAIEVLQGAVATLDAQPEPDDYELSGVLNDLGGALAGVGRYEEAIAALTRALSLAERVLGGDQVDFAVSMMNLAIVRASAGELAGAVKDFERAAEIFEARLGREHLYSTNAISALASARQRTGDLEGAERDYRRALDAWTSLRGEHSPEVAKIRQELGIALLEQGRTDEAIEQLEAGLAELERIGGSEPDLAYSRFLAARGRFARRATRVAALELAQRSLLILRAHGPARAGMCAQIEAWLGEHGVGVEPPVD